MSSTSVNCHDPVIEVERVSKRFCKKLKQSMRYGFKDLLACCLPGRKQSCHLRKDEFWALENIDLTLHRGDVLGVLGINGSGKTTLMKIMAGVFPFEKGRVTVNGRVVPLFALSTGIHSLYTGRENAYVRGALYGLSHAQMEERIDQIVDFSELGDFIDSPVGIYSSGMKSRLAYSIALVSDPDVMIIDETLAVGDIAFKEKCFSHIQNLSQEKAIVFVSKQPARIRKIANRAMVMHAGRKVCDSQDVEEAVEYYLDVCIGPDKKVDRDLVD